MDSAWAATAAAAVVAVPCVQSLPDCGAFKLVLQVLDVDELLERRNEESNLSVRSYRSCRVCNLA